MYVCSIVNIAYKNNPSAKQNTTCSIYVQCSFPYFQFYLLYVNKKNICAKKWGAPWSSLHSIVTRRDYIFLRCKVYMYIDLMLNVDLIFCVKDDKCICWMFVLKYSSDGPGDLFNGVPRPILVITEVCVQCEIW